MDGEDEDVNPALATFIVDDAVMLDDAFMIDDTIES